MGKTRPPERNKRKRTTPNGTASKSPKQLLAEAAELLEISDPQGALKQGLKALKQLRQTANDIERLPALALLGETSLQLGDIDSARSYFQESAEIDQDGEIPEERGGGPEKFFWLAQLSEEGGLDSVRWYQKGADVLRKHIAQAVAQAGDDEELADPSIYENRVKLANALCGIAEVYMTDLSFDDAEAEEQCNKAVEEALSVAPDQPTTLQTAASVRISQLRKDDARQLLRSSLDLWKDLDIEDPDVPDFATRISLSRLLMEAEMEDEAIEVLERLIREDDQSVEAWYLGGWCLHLLAQKEKDKPTESNDDTQGVDEEEELLRRSRKWLLKSLDLYRKLDYEDERLREHALELVQTLNEILGAPEENEGDDEDDEDEWEGIEDSEDEEMVGA